MLNREEIKNLPQLLTPHELAQAMGISLPFCYKLIRTKGFPSFRVGKKWLIATDKLMEWIDERLEQAIIETKAKLVILDPLQAYIGASVDMHRANEIRPIMKHLAEVAQRQQCAVVLIGHLNKAMGMKSSYRGLGSIDIPASARSVLLVGRIKDNPTVRAMAQIKSSLAPEGEPIAFELNKETGFHFIGKYDISVDDLLNGMATTSKLERAEMLLKDKLSDESVIRQTELKRLAETMHIKERTLNEAKKNLGIISKKEDNLLYTKKLTDKDRTRLGNLLDSEFKDTISFMLENNCKLEQEALDEK